MKKYIYTTFSPRVQNDIGLKSMNIPSSFKSSLKAWYLGYNLSVGLGVIKTMACYNLLQGIQSLPRHWDNRVSSLHVQKYCNK